MFEGHHQPLLSRPEFARRVLRHFLFASGALVMALGIGVVGYHVLARLGWIDSLLNASMILGGMGPVSPLETDGAKLFASFYALFGGLVFVAMAGVLLGPFLHRLMHRFHVDEPGENGDAGDDSGAS
jgi:hypothetical protein